jgi:NYN domain
MTMSQPLAAGAKSRVALLIDGDNISPDSVGQIILKAARFGDLTIRRVYGNAQAPAGWSVAPGIRFVHSGSGKNATDILMTVEAMSVILTEQADMLVLATSDRDFVHLATHLREKSVTVIGIGEAKAPESFRKACTRFLELKDKRTAETAGQDSALSSEAPDHARDIDDQIRTLILTKGEDGALPIVRLGSLMHSLHKIIVDDLSHKTWRSYLIARPDLFDCDPRGPDACVRLRAARTGARVRKA